ncbi:MAG TPA: F0F1 ATP synthase subunit A [Alphaproteobacteria bacterium]|nr:F0F1 ATP synthase subunit A [Alphaproteobacteria bacterium]
MASPLEQFTIKPITPIEIGGVDLMFTNSSLMMVLGVLLSAGFLLLAGRKAALVPGRLQGFAEVSYQFIAGMVKENAGPEGMKYFPLIFSIFTFVLMGNLLGMMPFSFTYTSHLIVTLALALMVIITVIVVGLLRHGLHFFSLFFPSGVPWPIYFILTPVEIISFLARPFSLSMRLFLNMMAGHMVLKIFAGFCVMMVSLGGLMSLTSIVPFAVKFAVTGFEFGVAFLQAYIFTVFTCLYLRDAIYLHGHDDH